MSYQDSINSTFLYILGGIVAVFVLLQSAIFLVRAYKQGLAMGMDKKKLNGAIKSSAVFSIVPSLPIVIGLFALTALLGVPISWIRLSVVGSVSYEMIAADLAAKAMNITNFAEANIDIAYFATIVLIMSIGIIWGLVMCSVNGVKLVQKGMDKMQNTDKTWGEMFVGALFMGMVAAFFGSIVSPQIVGMLREKDQIPIYKGLTTIFVLITSAILMFVFTEIAKKFKKLKWIDDFALPISMVMAMALALAYNAMLGGNV